MGYSQQACALKRSFSYALAPGKLERRWKDLSRKLLADVGCQEDPISLFLAVAKAQAEGMNYLCQWLELLTTSETTRAVFPCQADWWALRGFDARGLMDSNLRVELS